MTTPPPAIGVAVAAVDRGESQPRTAIATRGRIMRNERGIDAGLLLMGTMIVPAPRQEQTRGLILVHPLQIPDDAGDHSLGAQRGGVDGKVGSL
jgi:hypothetical protein